MFFGKITASALASFAFAIAACAETLFVAAGSDFQAETDARSARNVSAILAQMKADGCGELSAVLFCGDYTVKLNNRADESLSGIAALKSELLRAGLGVSDEKIVLAQGNHDPVGTKKFLAPSGGNDPADKRFGVFVINEDDYMWHQSCAPTDGNADVSDDAETVARTARALDEYLEEKLAENFRAPIFVVSHLPLHYSMRTFCDGDGRFAKYILDTLNRHGKAGLNIIFLFGHNHSNGWDNYLGGASVFLPRGSELTVAVPEYRKKCARERIDFTYMNAGYTGYYSTSDPNDSADRTLSMTLFEISPDGNVRVKRFSPQGPCPLKARGVPNTRADDQESRAGLYRPDESVLFSN